MAEEKLSDHIPGSGGVGEGTKRAEKVPKNDEFEDCLSCRLTGAGAFIGLGIYSYYSGHRQLKLQHQQILKSGSRFGMKSRQAGITSIALTLIGLGAYRLVN